MTINDLTTVIKRLITSGATSVHLPDFGSFVIDEIPSRIINNGKSITPPDAKIYFDGSDAGEDEYLAQSGNTQEYTIYKLLSKTCNTTQKQAKENYKELIKKIKQELINNGHVEFPQFGSINFGPEKCFTFTPDLKHYSPAAEYYGLEALSLKAYTPATILEIAPLEVSTPEEINSEEIIPEEIQQEEIIPEEIIPEEIQSSEITAEEFTPDKISAEEITAKEISAEEIPAEEISEDEISADEITAEEIAEDEISADEIPADEITTEEISEEETAEVTNPETGNSVEETEVVVETSEILSEKTAVKEETDSKTGKTQKVILITIGVIVAISLLLFISVMLFKDEMMPLLERILYSKEDLEFLKSIKKVDF